MTRRLFAAAGHVVLVLALAASAAADTPVDVLYSFPTGRATADPDSPLTLVGSTLYGGTNQSLFSFPVGGSTATTLHSFTLAADGISPYAGVTAIGSTLYGTTSIGGPSVGGSLYSIGTDGSNYTDLQSFGGLSNYQTVGEMPSQPMIAIGTTLYGTTTSQGPNGNGAIFSFNTTTSTLGEVAPLPAGSNAGGPVLGPLVNVGNTLYGTAVGGGAAPNAGTIFSVNTDGTDYTTLYTIPGSSGLQSCALTLVGSTLYGIGGSAGFGDGEIFSMNLDGSDFSVLHTFTGLDGDFGFGPMILVGTTLYDTSFYGGADNDGTIFSFNTLTDTFAAVHSFTGTDGTAPQGLTLVGSMLYGTTERGGVNNAGVIFAIATPEPSSIALAVAGLPLLAWLGWRIRGNRTPHCQS